MSIFCAGVAQGSDGELLTAGGRVLNVTALGRTRGAARERAYRAVGCLTWPGMVVRSDIALADREAPNRPG